MKLSAYFVVKNEIKNLPEIIPEVLKFADQIVVVDTGSTDGTWEYLGWLESHSNVIIKLMEFDPGEYSASKARNFAIGLCKGEWILALDGDEYINYEYGMKLKKFIIENSAYDSFRLPIFNFLQHPKYISDPKRLDGSATRVFRNKLGIYYEYNIHPVLRGLQKTGIIDVAIYHFQFLEAEKIKPKSEFRIKQLIKRIEKLGWTSDNYRFLADIFRRKYLWTGNLKDLRKAAIFLKYAAKESNNPKLKLIQAQLEFEYNQREKKNAERKKAEQKSIQQKKAEQKSIQRKKAKQKK